jgi:hypothetical protein
VDALMGDNSSSLSGTVIWTPNGKMESDGVNEAAASTACIFAGLAFEQHFNVFAGSPVARQNIVAASQSYNVARAVPVGRIVPASAAATGDSSASYGGNPVVAGPIYLAGVTDVSGYLCGPVHAVGTVWGKTFVSAKGRRSKPISGALAGSSRVLATAA